MRLLTTDVKIAAVLLVSLTALVYALMSRPERVRALAMAAGWLVPGAGHALLGRWKKGLFFFLLLGATYLAGLWIVGFRPVSLDENPFYYVGQYGSGATMLLAKAMGPDKSYPRDAVPVSWYDPGLLYVCVAGLLNLVVVFNLLDVRRPDGAVAEPKAAEPAGAVPGAPGEAA